MTYLRPLCLFPILALVLAGCGQNRSALAQQTVQTYWTDIATGKFNQAYNLLTSDNRASQPLSSWSQDIIGFLTNVGGVSPKVGTPEIHDDTATVPLTLTSPKTSIKLHAYQHLFWENGHWRISDNGGTVSRTK